MKWLRMVSVLVLLVMAGCKGECGHFVAIVNDREKVAALEAWADRAVFAEHFTEQHFGWIGGFSGPGLRVFRTASVPDGFHDHLWSELRVRALGEETSEIEGIFIGARSYAGIVIARKSIAELIDRKIILPGEVKGLQSTEGRVVAMCRHAFD